MQARRVLVVGGLLAALLALAGVGPGQVRAAPGGQAAAPQSIQLPGRVLGDLNLRSEPRVGADTLLRVLGHNEPVWVYESVPGADGDTWYRVGDGEYVHAAEVRLPRPPPQTYAGHWLDVDLQEPTLITAYEDDRAVNAMLAIHGRTADETERGEYHILRRVEDETMDSETLGVPHDDPNGYYLEHVMYTQYFTSDGAALHDNYWSDAFGYAGSHGCLGLSNADAQWLWDWADVGTVLNIHD
jgi:L,D-transpeptidase catalytic domain